MISSQQLGERFADARKAARLTQAEVAGRLGMARTTLVAIEKGERRPSNTELVRLAEIVGASVHALLREHAVRAELSPRFRLMPGISRDADGVVAAVERLRTLGQRYAELEQMNGIEPGQSRLGALQTYRAEQVGSLDPKMLGQDAAATVRGLLGLGDEPALDLDDRFELEGGLRIFYLDRIPATLGGLLIWGDEIGACVGINSAHPAERRRLSLVHEFGHFLRDREAGDVLEADEPSKDPAEMFADSFGVGFLMPATGIARRFADRCRSSGNRFSALDIFSLARMYQVSFQAMSRRLEELGFLPRGTYDRLSASKIRARDLAERAGVPFIPGPPPPPFPRRYVELAVRAYDSELLSEGELAEIFDTDRVMAREIYQRHEHLSLDDGRELSVSLAAEDLRA